MPRQSKAAIEAAKEKALAFLKAVKTRVDVRKKRDRLGILAQESHSTAEYAQRIALANKAQKILNRVGAAIRDGRLVANDLDKAKLREIAGQALADWKAEQTMQNLIRTVYNAGRFEYQIGDKTRPMWLYRTMRDAHVRPSHAKLEGLLLPAGDPYLVERYPPNGHGCRCRIDALTQGQANDLAKRSGKVQTKAPADPEVAYVDKATGKRMKTPESVDPGFAGPPNASPGAVGKLLERQIALLRGWTPPV